MLSGCIMSSASACATSSWILAERGIVVTHESIRHWCLKFGADFARKLRRRRPQPGDTWHLDEVFIRIRGVLHYLWRAVDQHGVALDILVQERRNGAAAGRANAATITTLQPTGTSIPGNSDYPVDNLIRATAPHLTKHGFGFMAADGACHNPLHAGHSLDYISRPPYADGKGAEPTIRFKAVGAASDSHCPTE